MRRENGKAILLLFFLGYFYVLYTGFKTLIGRFYRWIGEKSQNQEIAPESANDGNFQCEICYENGRQTVLSPCGHCTCYNCSTAISLCPFCRQDIGQKIRVFR